MKVLIAFLLLVNLLVAQRGGMGRGSGGYRGGGGWRGPAVGHGFQGHLGGGFRSGMVRGRNYGYRGGFIASHRYYGSYRYGRYRPFFGYGWPAYGFGYYGSSFWGYPWTYGTGGYGYPYASGPSVSVITVPNSWEPSPVISITNNRTPNYERANPVQSDFDRPSEAKTESLRSPIYLIAAKNGTIWAAQSYSVENDKLNFFTLRGEGRVIALSDVDRTLTAELNAQAGITLRLP